MAVYRILKSVVFDGMSDQVTVDVSDAVPDARSAIYSLYDPDGLVIEGAVQPSDQYTVKVNLSPAPPAGTYRLVGLA